MIFSRAFPTVIAAAILGACASQPTNQVSAAGEKPSPTASRPLERMAGQQVLVLPVQYISFQDSLGWQQAVPNRAAYLARLDTVIASTLTARGLGQAWTFGPEVARAARLNSIIMPDARALSPNGSAADFFPIRRCAIHSLRKFAPWSDSRAHATRSCPWRSGSRDRVVQALRH